MLKLATKFRPDAGAFALAQQVGYGFAELWLDAPLLAEWEKIAEQASAYPFEYVLHFPNSLKLEPATLGHVVELYRALGCRCMVIHQPMFDRFEASLLELEPKLSLAIENHKLTPDGFDSWAAESPALTLDVEHLWKFTLKDCPLPTLLEAVARFLETHRSKLGHVHLPGYWPGLAEHRPMYCAREMIFPVLNLLQNAHFAGLVVSEADAAYQNANELRMDVLLGETWRTIRRAERRKPPG